MQIQFKDIAWKEVKNFKGGEQSIFMKMFDDGKQKIAMLKFPPGASIGMHRHEGSNETIFVLEGNGEMLEDGTSVPLKPGDCSYCPEGGEHSLRNNSSEDLLVFAVIPNVPVEPVEA